MVASKLDERAQPAAAAESSEMEPYVSSTQEQPCNEGAGSESVLLRDIRSAIARKDVDMLIAMAKYVTPADAAAARALYEQFYMHEDAVARGIQNIVSSCKGFRTRRVLPLDGSYTFNLE